MTCITYKNHEPIRVHSQGHRSSWLLTHWGSFCCCSVIKSSLTFCDPGLQHAGLLCPHHLLAFAQIHFHGVHDAMDTWQKIHHPLLPSFSFCLQSLPAPGSFPMSWLFISGGQSTGTSASLTVLPINSQGWFPLGLSGLILQSQGLSRVFSSITIWKHHFFGTQPPLWSNSHPYMATGKTMVLTLQTFVSTEMSLLFNKLSRFVIAFLPRNNQFLISWLQSPSTVILEHRKIKSGAHFRPE